MPRILGVDIPNDRKTVVSLTYLYGVGGKTARELCHKAGIDPNKPARDLAEDELGRLAALLERDYVVEGPLRRQLAQNISRLRAENGSGRVKWRHEDDTFDYELTNANIVPIPTGIEDLPAPTASVQIQVMPNPFNPRTTIEYDLPRDQHATIAVYDLLGRRVRELLNTHLAAGVHRVTWDGTDGSGRALPSSVYLVRLVTDTGTQARKVMLIK